MDIYRPIEKSIVLVRRIVCILIYIFIYTFILSHIAGSTRRVEYRTTARRYTIWSARIYLFLFCFQTCFLSHLVHVCSYAPSVFSFSHRSAHFASFFFFFTDYGDLQLHRWPVRPHGKRCIE